MNLIDVLWTFKKTEKSRPTRSRPRPTIQTVEKFIRSTCQATGPPRSSSSSPIGDEKKAHSRLPVPIESRSPGDGSDLDTEAGVTGARACRRVFQNRSRDSRRCSWRVGARYRDTRSILLALHLRAAPRVRVAWLAGDPRKRCRVRRPDRAHLLARSREAGALGLAGSNEPLGHGRSCAR